MILKCKKCQNCKCETMVGLSSGAALVQSKRSITIASLTKISLVDLHAILPLGEVALGLVFISTF